MSTVFIPVLSAKGRIVVIICEDTPMALCGGVNHVFVHRSLLSNLLSSANGAGEAQGIVGRTPPQSAARTKSRQAKTPTQTCEFVITHYVPF